MPLEFDGPKHGVNRWTTLWSLLSAAHHYRAWKLWGSVYNFIPSSALSRKISIKGLQIRKPGLWLVWLSCCGCFSHLNELRETLLSQNSHLRVEGPYLPSPQPEKQSVAKWRSLVYIGKHIKRRQLWQAGDTCLQVHMFLSHTTPLQIPGSMQLSGTPKKLLQYLMFLSFALPLCFPFPSFRFGFLNIYVFLFTRMGVFLHVCLCTICMNAHGG